MSITTKFFLYFIILSSLSCKPQTARNFSGFDQSAEVDAGKIEQLEQTVEQDLVTKNENGEVTDLKGFQPSSALSDAGSDQELREMYQNDEELFEFTPPEGVEAEFSAPSMITGSSLLLTDNNSGCRDSKYQENEPGYKEIIDDADSKNICGLVSLDFCIRMIPAGLSSNRDKDSFVYTKTPSFVLQIPCKSDSFTNLTLAIADGMPSTENTIETVRISANSSVLEVYLTNSPDCSTGGAWEKITSDGRQWQLDFVDNTANVYAKFRDRFGVESECISDSIQYGPSADACFAGDANYKAENIKSGVDIGDIAGTANLGYPVCTYDGQVGCIVTGAFQTHNSNGLATKIMDGETVGGVAGAVAKETRLNCTAGGQESCITTSLYRSMDLSSKDAGGALDIDSSSFSARVKSSAAFEFWDEMGARYTAAGDADISEANILDGTEVFGVTGTAGAAPDCSSIPFGAWILVPGDPDYGTNDFCVMKYEAKCSLADGSTCTASASSESPTSTVANTPWMDVDQQESIIECASLGRGYHLITNDEWMTIASNVASVGANWDGGVVGTNEMTRGHSDNNPSNVCAADASDANAYVQGTCAGSSSGTFNQRRTFILSNGEVIWDLAGNAYEWTSDFNDEEKATPNTSTYYEYTEPVIGTTTMPLSDLIPTNAVKSYWNDSWNSSQSIGSYFPGADGAGGVIVRGGRWGNTSDAGVFSADLDYAPNSTTDRIGFRCVIAVP